MNFDKSEVRNIIKQELVRSYDKTRVYSRIYLFAEFIIFYTFVHVIVEFGIRMPLLQTDIENFSSTQLTNAEENAGDDQDEQRTQ